MRLKKLYVCLLSILAYSTANGQTAKTADMNEFKARLEQSAAGTSSIESNFTQVKHLDIFDEDITSKGKFYYRAEGKICLDYTTPVGYLIVINGEKIKIESDGKKNVMSLKDNAMMKEMRGMLAACFSGNLSDMSGYKMDVTEDAKTYYVTITPASKSIQEYIKSFMVNMDKTDMSVARLRIQESATDYTDYLFSNKKFNTLTDDSKFSVR